LPQFFALVVLDAEVWLRVVFPIRLDVSIWVELVLARFEAADVLFALFSAAEVLLHFEFFIIVFTSYILQGLIPYTISFGYYKKNIQYLFGKLF